MTKLHSTPNHVGEECEAQSWSPEVITLYGDSDTVNGKLADLDINLPHRRVFGFTVEGEGKSKGAFFEKTSPNEATVYKWSGQSDRKLHDEIADEIVRNRGVNCIGEQTKAILAKLPGLQTERCVAIPVNAKAAFSHQVREAGAGYIKTTVYLFC